MRAYGAERERSGSEPPILPAMEKRIELEKRGKKPGDVRQPLKFLLLRRFTRLPPIFISAALSSPPPSPYPRRPPRPARARARDPSLLDVRARGTRFAFSHAPLYYAALVDQW